MSRLIPFVSTQVERSTDVLDVKKKLLEESRHLEPSLHGWVRHILTGSEAPDAEPGEGDLVGLAMCMFALMELGSMPSWSSAMLDKYLKRFFAIPGASRRAVLEAIARLLPTTPPVKPALSFADLLNRIHRYIRPRAISSEDFEYLKPFTDDKPGFWYFLIPVADETGNLNPDTLARALLALRHTPEESDERFFHDPALDVVITTHKEELGRAEFRGRVLERAEQADPEGVVKLQEAFEKHGFGSE